MSVSFFVCVFFLLVCFCFFGATQWISWFIVFPYRNLEFNLQPSYDTWCTQPMMNDNQTPWQRKTFCVLHQNSRDFEKHLNFFILRILNQQRKLHRVIGVLWRLKLTVVSFDITVGTSMLRDSIIYFHLDLSVSVAGGIRPLFVMALTRWALDWNTQVLKGGQALWLWWISGQY